MLTRLAIRGFKSFNDVEVVLRPFQVIVGVNAAGKSNLFDALLLLGRIANSDLQTAFNSGRGNPDEYFTRIGSTYLDTMSLKVDMLVPPQVRDDWGQNATLRFNRLRYTIKIRRENDANSDRTQLMVLEESLKPISRSEDPWLKGGTFLADGWLPKLTGGRSKGFISTETNGDILLHQDGHGGKQQRPAGPIRSILSSVATAEFPHALAARKQLSQIRLLQFDATAMRQPVPFDAPDILSVSGDNLAAVLARLARTDPRILTNMAAEISSFVPHFSAISVQNDTARRLYTLWARHGSEDFSSKVLSDGTLRLIALASMKSDPNQTGTLLFEEPENGVHPSRLKQVAEILKDIPTDFKIGPEDEPLRQILVNSHSPSFVAEIDDRDLLVVHAVQLVSPGQPPELCSRITPVRTDQLPIDEQRAFFARHEVYAMLEEQALSAAKARLN